MAFSATAIDNKLWDIRKQLMEKVGVSYADIYLSPLTYYINTGRASTEFLKHMINAKTFMIVRKLLQAGSDMEVIERIRKYLGMENVN